MAKKNTAIITKLLPLLYFALLTFILFHQYFLKGKIPVPGDILLGHYYPWKDQVWENLTAGFPVKNFILFDGIRQTLPWRLFAIDQIKAGQLPLWNPYILSGTPLLANLQVAILYPLNLLFFIFSKYDAWTIYVILQPFLGSLFAYVFLRSIYTSKTGSLLGGTCFGFSLIMLNHLEFGIDGHTALWLPLALAGINKINKEGKIRWGLVLMLSIVMTLLGGYPPPAIYNLLIISAYVIFKCRPIFSKKTLLIFGFGLLAFGLCAVQIIPAVELARKVIRDESQFGTLSSEVYFFPWENLIMFIASDFFGHPSTNNFFSKIYYTDNPSIGIIGFIFVIYSLFIIRKSKEVKFWWLVVMIPLLLMFSTPLGKALRLIKNPFISMVTPIRMIWVVSAGLSILAGIGVDVLININKKIKSIFKLLLPVFLTAELFIIAWVLSFIIPPEGKNIIAQRNLILPTLFLMISFLTITFILIFPKSIKLLLICLVFLSGVELVRQGIKYNPFIKKELVFPAIEIFQDIPDLNYSRSLVTHAELLPVNSNLPYLIPMIDGYASISDGRYGQMVKLANSTYPVEKIEGYPRIVFQTGYQSQIIDLLGVKYIYSLDDLKNEKLKIKKQIGQTRIYENIQVLPKIFPVNDYLIGTSDIDIANKMLTTDLTKTVVLEEKPKLTYDDKLPNNIKYEMVSYSVNGMLIKSSAVNSFLMLINDAYDVGWKANINNVPTKVLRANFDLRAIEVPKGDSIIKIFYSPKSFWRGIFLSLISLLILFIICLRNYLFSKNQTNVIIRKYDNK